MWAEKLLFYLHSGGLGWSRLLCRSCVATLMTESMLTYCHHDTHPISQQVRWPTQVPNQAGHAHPASGWQQLKSPLIHAHGLLFYLSAWAVGSDQPFLCHMHKPNPGQLSALLVTSMSGLAKLPSSAQVCVWLRVSGDKLCIVLTDVHSDADRASAAVHL